MNIFFRFIGQVNIQNLRKEVLQKPVLVKKYLFYKDGKESKLMRSCSLHFKKAILCCCRNKRFTVPRYVGDIDNDEIVTPAEAKRNIMLAKNKIMQQRKKIRYLQQQHRRSKIKIGTLQMLLDHLTNNKTEDSELTINVSFFIVFINCSSSKF